MERLGVEGNRREQDDMELGVNLVYGEVDEGTSGDDIELAGEIVELAGDELEVVEDALELDLEKLAVELADEGA
ncbi:hypothetical protein HWV62_39790 [Athelia sp. TMB]|nr:hypothetical protein HWV62_39790 [Athelia sp. TMB]